MLIIYCFAGTAVCIAAYIIQAVSYMRILKRMGKNRLFGLVPLLGDWQMSKDLFKRRRQFLRPVIVTGALMITGLYVGFDTVYGALLRIAAFLVYGIFLTRLYWRLPKRFGRGKGFALGLIFITGIFLPVLAFGKKEYLGPAEFKPDKERSKKAQNARRAVLAVVSTVEVLALVLACFAITMYAKPFRPVSQYILKEQQEMLKGITADDDFVTRSDTLGEEADSIIASQKSREHYQKPYEEGDKVVVMEYIIGSNLENRAAEATLNIEQMKEATGRGDGLSFVIEAGGSQRWFTGGIEDGTVGRYEISGGDLKEKKMLPETTCMTEPKNLKDFITWTKENYPADRYMLVLWDHGGGFATGYGQDDLNGKPGSGSTMTSSEIVGAVRDSGVKFDMIGFDACLMQGIELANALEPYADYYLASQESEPGTGWYYTEAFGKLAEDPSMTTEELGGMLVSTFDKANMKLNNDKADSRFTLSLIDLALVGKAYDSITDMYGSSTESMPGDPSVFANYSAARAKAYCFEDDQQVDLADLMRYLKSADYKDEVANDKEIDELIKSVKACVVCRNGDSAAGINGLSCDFPYESLSFYTDSYKQLKKLKYKKQEKFFNNFCSILAAQNKAAEKKEDNGKVQEFFSQFDSVSEEPWYVEGYEDYDAVKTFVDIPLTELEEGYAIELPKSAWDIVTDAVTAAYVVTDKGRMYLGAQHLGGRDAEGHPIVTMDDTWVSIDGRTVCYDAQEPAETKDGIVYKGTAMAVLNGKEEIELQIEWDPVKEEGDPEAHGHVLGYKKTHDRFAFMEKGLYTLDSGDTLKFKFSWYDENGEEIKSGTYGKGLRVITMDKLDVAITPLEGDEIEYFGVLRDVYQRELFTEVITEKF